jgi:hypothetical protein
VILRIVEAFSRSARSIARATILCVRLSSCKGSVQKVQVLKRFYRSDNIMKGAPKMQGDCEPDGCRVYINETRVFSGVTIAARCLSMVISFSALMMQ